MNTTRLTRKIVDEIVKRVKLRMSWTDIAKAIGVTRETIYNWRKKGEACDSGIHRELYDAIQQAETEMLQQSLENIHDGLVGGQEIVTRKVITDSNGNQRTEITTTIQQPDIKLSQWVAERLDREQWALTQKVDIDWKDDIAEQGHDPDKVTKIIQEYIRMQQSDTEPDEEPDATDTPDSST